MRKFLVYGSRLLVAIAAAWAVGASIYLSTTIASERGASELILRDSTTVLWNSARAQSWYEAQGLWGILWLVIFSGFYLQAVRVVWRGNRIALANMSVAAVALSIATGFSIGSAYLPAALSLFIGALMLLTSALVKPQC